MWQRAMGLTTRIYRETQGWPSEERYGLTSQIRRAASSIPLNIAEGAGNSSRKEFCRFLEIALRSCYEVITAAEIARSLAYLDDACADGLVDEVGEIAAMLVGLMKSMGGVRTGNAVA
ncbi:MAG: four helix bundle protein [Anaerolineae bacterium]|nr:four helix bundle protein [Anaerolineae bacterium]